MEYLVFLISYFCLVYMHYTFISSNFVRLILYTFVGSPMYVNEVVEINGDLGNKDHTTNINEGAKTIREHMDKHNIDVHDGNGDTTTDTVKNDPLADVRESQMIIYIGPGHTYHVLDVTPKQLTRIKRPAANVKSPYVTDFGSGDNTGVRYYLHINPTTQYIQPSVHICSIKPARIYWLIMEKD